MNQPKQPPPEGCPFAGPTAMSNILFPSSRDPSFPSVAEKRVATILCFFVTSAKFHFFLLTFFVCCCCGRQQPGQLALIFIKQITYFWARYGKINFCVFKKTCLNYDAGLCEDARFFFAWSFKKRCRARTTIVVNVVKRSVIAIADDKLWLKLASDLR